MASKLMLLIVAIVVVILPNVAIATEYVVGDDKGWGLKVNYTKWAAGKEFFVGDSLVFNYSSKFHNVYKVSGPEFQECQVPNGAEPMNSGFDIVQLASPGKKWYLCGVANHCNLGQKLVITVLPSSSAPSPSQTGSGAAISPYPAVFFAAFVVLMKAFV